MQILMRLITFIRPERKRLILTIKHSFRVLAATEQAIFDIFDSLNKKVWFKTFLNWLNSAESPYHAKSFNPDTDVGAQSVSGGNDGPSLEGLIDQAEEILSGLKPQYQKTFKMGYVWYKNHWEKSSLGYKELERIIGKKTSVLHEHFKKIENLFIKPLMGKIPHRKDLLREVFNSFRKKYSDHNRKKPTLSSLRKKRSHECRAKTEGFAQCL